LTRPAAKIASADASAKGSERASARISAALAVMLFGRAVASISGVRSTAMTDPSGPTASRSGGSARPVPQPTSMATPPRRTPASATAAQYPGRSSPNFVSQVEARQPKNARVSAMYRDGMQSSWRCGR
jgi:hypothetical protein